MLLEVAAATVVARLGAQQVQSVKLVVLEVNIGKG